MAKKKKKHSDLMVYCDLDGVLTDFQGAVKRMFGECHWDLYDTDKEAFWAPINEMGYVFWEAIPWLPKGQMLWKVLEPWHPTILTARSLHPMSMTGKLRWIVKNLGKQVADKAIVCLRREKAVLSEHGAVLIDDQLRNVMAWAEKGGWVVWYRHKHMNAEHVKMWLASFQRLNTFLGV